MAGQRNDAAERSAHVHRGGGSEPAPRRSSIIELPNGSFKLRAVHVRDNIIRGLSIRRRAQTRRADDAVAALLALHNAVTEGSDPTDALAMANKILKRERHV